MFCVRVTQPFYTRSKLRLLASKPFNFEPDFHETFIASHSPPNDKSFIPAAIEIYRSRSSTTCLCAMDIYPRQSSHPNSFSNRSSSSQICIISLIGGSVNLGWSSFIVQSPKNHGLSLCRFWVTIEQTGPKKAPFSGTNPAQAGCHRPRLQSFRSRLVINDNHGVSEKSDRIQCFCSWTL